MEQTFQSDDNAYPNFIVEYKFKGSTWATSIPAKSLEEAQARLKHIGMGEVLGEIKAEINAKNHFLQKLVEWWFR